MAYVYLIRHATEPRFKIGKANQPINRSSAFRESLDYENSLQIWVGSRALGLEKGLHALFDDFRLPPISDDDGATEWFRLECWDQCLLFLKQNQSLIKAEPEPIPVPTPAKRVVLTREERAERRRRNQEARRTKLLQENLESIERWEQFPTWLATKDVMAERINEYGSLDILIPEIPFEEFRSFSNSRIGWPHLEIENQTRPCGVQGTTWREDGQILTITVSPLPADAIDLMIENDLDPILQARVHAMQNWIAERMNVAGKN